MGDCWYCYYGWAKPVSDVYIEALSKAKGDSYVLECLSVWANENFHLAEQCLIEWPEIEADLRKRDLPKSHIDNAKWSLEELIKIPLDIRCPEPDSYDGGYNGEDVTMFPPAEGVQLVGKFEREHKAA